jgi:C_GCAxxG_C_C family probable redox protein
MAKIDVEKAKDLALEGFRASGADHLNCAQTVLRFASLVLDLAPDPVPAAQYFGGGIARTGQACGAVSGAALSLGFRDLYLGSPAPARRAADVAKLQLLVQDFEAEFGGLGCLQLVGYSIATSENFKRYSSDDEQRALCSKYVAWSCDRLYEILTSSD